MSDAELLNWLEEQEGVALISDDFGSWSVTGAGWQNIPEEFPGDIETTFFIEKDKWKPSIREAILAYMDEIG